MKIFIVSKFNKFLQITKEEKLFTNLKLAEKYIQKVEESNILLLEEVLELNIKIY